MDQTTAGILVAYVPGRRGDAALRAGAHEAALRQVTLHVLNVTWGLSPVERSTAVDDTSLQDTIARLRDDGLEVNFLPVNPESPGADTAGEIVRQAEAFLFDEPLSNLDAKLRVQMRTEIKELHQRLKTTTVYVTHDQVEAMTMADRIVVMNEGRIEQAGAPLLLYERPANLFVAGFIGAPRMNFLPSAAFPGGTGATTGIRPQHLRRAGDGEPTLKAKVTLIEQLGSETVVHGDADGHRLLAVLPGQQGLQTGEEVALAYDRENLHVFDEDGLRVE
jgi:hypothetical protein